MMVHGEILPVEIVRRRGRNLYLHIERDGSLRVTCSRLVSEKQIASFLKEREEWVFQKRAQILAGMDATMVSLKKNTLFWWGEEKQIGIHPGTRNSLVVGEKAVFTLKNMSQEDMDKAFARAASAEMMEQIHAMRERYDEGICRKNGMPVPSITLRKMKSRWGVCNIRTMHITVNSQLIHYPLECLDYILLHEYTHLLVPDHSQAFYRIVQEWMPDYKDRIRRLR